mmetsp:Transcript_60668/g.153421  ORF Transcript_60668/g.153421 Transcript_60668/m.153421 type:complete len:209 (-) Transcript_60668:937-1563(-)
MTPVLVPIDHDRINRPHRVVLFELVLLNCAQQRAHDILVQFLEDSVHRIEKGPIVQVPLVDLDANLDAERLQRELRGAPEDQQEDDDDDDRGVEQDLLGAWLVVDVNPIAHLQHQHESDASPQPSMPHHEKVLAGQQHGRPVTSASAHLLDGINEETHWEGGSGSPNQQEENHPRAEVHTCTVSDDEIHTHEQENTHVRHLCEFLHEE